MGLNRASSENSQTPGLHSLPLARNAPEKATWNTRSDTEEANESWVRSMQRAHLPDVPNYLLPIIYRTGNENTLCVERLVFAEFRALFFAMVERAPRHGGHDFFDQKNHVQVVRTQVGPSIRQPSWWLKWTMHGGFLPNDHPENCTWSAHSKKKNVMIHVRRYLSLYIYVYMFIYI